MAFKVVIFGQNVGTRFATTLFSTCDSGVAFGTVSYPSYNVETSNCGETCFDIGRFYRLTGMGQQKDNS